MVFFKDQTGSIVLFGLIFLCLVYVFLTYSKKQSVEGFTSAPQLLVDAENPDLTNGDIFGLVPAAASASIFKKKDARDKANSNNLPYDKSSGQYYIEAVNIDLNPDPNDIQSILEAELNKPTVINTTVKKSGFKDYDSLATIEGFDSPQQIAAQAAIEQAQKKVQAKVQEKLLKSKAADKAATVAIKQLNKLNMKISQKMGNRLGANLAKKVTERLAQKIAETVGKKAATATASGAVATATPDPSGLSQAIGIMLTVIGAAGLAAQITVASVLKGEEGFCPSGYQRLNTAIPSFMSMIPGIGDILGVMGPYVCFRNSCEPNEDDDAGLCYDKCDKGYKGVGPVCWANSNDVGAGALKECPPGWTNDGLTCREPISTSIDPCPSGSKDVAGTCWGKQRTCVGGCGGDCGTWKCCGCSWSYDRDVVTRNVGERNMRTTGGRVKGRAAGSDLPCPKASPIEIDGLCYKGCPADTPNRVKGMPYLCSSASRVGDGRGGTSYGRGVGRPKLKMKTVEKDPTPQPAPPPTHSSAAFADDPNTACKADFTSRDMLAQMAKFYYNAAAKVPTTVSGGIQLSYISKISRVVASSEQSCDVLCDITTVTLSSATSKMPTASTTEKDKTRRFYFAKIASKCLFIVTAATNKDNTGKEIIFPDASPTSVNFIYNPFV